MPHGALTIKDSRNLFMKEDDEKGSRKKQSNYKNHNTKNF